MERYRFDGLAVDNSAADTPIRLAPGDGGNSESVREEAGWQLHKKYEVRFKT